jgi:D-alanyl-D-alanine carboxypeptidase (penicillin-binding protein 5/6)
MVAPFRLDALRDTPPPDEPSPPDGRAHRRAAAASRRKHRRRRALVLLAVLALLVVAAAAAFVGIRLSAAAPPPTTTSMSLPSVGVPTKTVPLPWPTMGQGAVDIPSVGAEEVSGPQQPVPVASLTKLMTAYVILRDHPLAPNESGPHITVTQADVDDYDTDTVSDDSNAQVTLGEQLTELQVLEGLLIHSADNYADLLARWDAGSVPAFVTKMNDAAATLGMRQSHFADPSGVSPQSMSTAADILKAAAADMAHPVVDSIVDNTSVTLPVAGTISTYTPLLGLDGIVGVKSGFTTEAGGCDVVAVERTVHGRQTLLLAAVTGQQQANALAAAGLHGLALVNAVQPLIGTTTVLRSGMTAAHVAAAGQSVAASTTASVSMLTWPGVSAARVFHPGRQVSDQAKRGARVGTVVVTMGTQRAVVPVRLTRDVPQRSMLQRIF